MCELLAIVVKFMLRSPILLSESTSENLTGAQRDDAKFRSFLRRESLYESGEKKTKSVACSFTKPN